MPDINQKDLQEFLGFWLKNKDLPPIFISGPPGIGKSAIVKQAAEKAEFKFIDVRLSMMAPTDISGIPFKGDVKHEDGTFDAMFSRPIFLPRENENGVVFLDEIPNASPHVQATSLQLIYNHCVGQHVVGDKWRFIAAGNDVEDSLASYELIEPLANRFIHFKLIASPNHWLTWATEKVNSIPRIHPIVTNFISGTNYLEEKDREKKKKAFATPRTWEYVSQLIYTMIGNQIPFSGPAVEVGPKRRGRPKLNLVAQGIQPVDGIDGCRAMINNHLLMLSIEAAVGQKAAHSLRSWAKTIVDTGLIVPDPAEFLSNLKASDVATTEYIKTTFEKIHEANKNMTVTFAESIARFAMGRIGNMTNDEQEQIKKGRAYDDIIMHHANGFISYYLTINRVLKASRIPNDSRRSIITIFDEEFSKKYIHLVKASYRKDWEAEINDARRR